MLLQDEAQECPSIPCCLLLRSATVVIKLEELPEHSVELPALGRHSGKRRLQESGEGAIRRPLLLV